MGERAKVILNEYSAKNLLMRDTLDLDKFYTADLKLFVEVARKEIERLNNIIEEYKNANEYHQNIIHELETMKQPNQLYSENVKLRSENKRLNNIIKEVREYLTDEGVCILNKGKQENERLVWTWENYYDLLEILKGSDKE